MEIVNLGVEDKKQFKRFLHDAHDRLVRCGDRARRFDGDGKTDAADFNAGTGTIKKSSNGQTQTITFGTTGDKPVVGDYDGDGISDCAIFRPSTNTWWILYSSNGSYVSTAFGNTGDITAQGNYDGDSKTDIAVYRPSTGVWHIQGSTAGYSNFNWGVAADIPVPADFDGDGKTDIAVYRGSTGTWYVAKSSANNTTYIEQIWGNYGDQPTPADYDNDGKVDFAIWRPTTGTWFIIKSGDSTYDYPVLGVSGETAVQSAYLKQIGSYVYSYDFAKARLSPKNATGGTDLYSRNFSWSSGLVGLPGRAGLDAGFGISFNSLVWTKDAANNSIVFDADNSNVTPGFRFGFPTVEPVYYDGQTGKFSFLMVAPSGGRVEFRQTAASNTYETADSSYTQLKINDTGTPEAPAEDLSLTVTTTDGTSMLYEWKNGAYRCKEIKDRNGNYISIVHDAYGLLQTVTDTLGRVVTVNYANGDRYPTSITQTWKDGNGQGSNVTHTWATFTYTTQQITTNFSGLTVIGPGDGYSQKVLQKITYPNNSYTTFDYNTWGQVIQINNYAADTHKLNHVKVNLPADATTAQTDCPRFTETRSFVENFNGGNETVVTNSITENQNYSVDGASGTATKIEVSMQSDPYGSVSKTFVGSSGWNESLPIATEDWANGTGGLERKRWTWTNWTQDDTTKPYIVNPRVTQTKGGDTANVKRTEIDYHMLSGASRYGLVSEVRVYKDSESTVWKKSQTDYNFDTAYISRRIIGLPTETRVYGYDQSTLSLEYVSRVAYGYDEENFTYEPNQNISSVIQHDTNYSASFIVGRGNLTSVTRHDVTGATAASVSKTRYDIAGSPVASIDAMNRKVTVSYTDSFNDGVNHNSFAYPTTVTDPASNYSQVKYRFDIGANVWAQSPAPAGQSVGKTTTREFDSIGRLLKETIVNTGAYSRYAYPNPDNGVQRLVYSTLVNVDGDSNIAEDEVLSESWTDGAGRVLFSRTEHPGSAGGWSGTKAEYDILGRLKRSTVPTEIDSSWNPDGDDSVWLWKEQEYDWKGRITREINTDGVSDRLYSYEGCGCAGGQVTTIRGEEIIENNWQGSSAQTIGRKTQKIYADILGRTWKTEVLNWDGSAYSRIINTFNGRDQITQSQEYDVANNVHQDTNLSYDGHGRGKTQHRPEQNANTYTTYNYNPDDSISSVTDARGATTSYSYNNRGLVEEISYTVPQSSTISVPGDVTFTFDAAGNRTQMTDGLGNVTYEYNELSQMTAETRQFTDNLPNAPISESRFKLEYSYTLGGQLNSLKDPYGQQINYSFDKIGRLNSVAGSASFGGITTYANNPHYRAWGGLQSLSYGNGTAMSMTFDNSLQANHFELTKTGQSQPVMSADYGFYADGSLRKVDDLVDNKFDRLNTFDNLGRPKAAKSGEEARGGTPTGEDLYNLPYRQSYQFNPFGNLTQRNHLHWGVNNFNLNYTYQNNRITNAASLQYDPDGRELAGQSGNQQVQSSYNAAGQLVIYHTAQGIAESETQRYYNGDGREEKRKTKSYAQDHNGNWTWFEDSPTFYIRSSVLSGEVVSDILPDGSKARTYVRAAGATIAWQNGSQSTGNVIFQHNDASGLSYRASDANGDFYGYEGFEGGPAEVDPLGGNVGKTNSYITQTPDQNCVGCEAITTEMPMYINGQPLRANSDGMEIPLSMARALISNGAKTHRNSDYTLNQFGIFRLIDWSVSKDGNIGHFWYWNVSRQQSQQKPKKDTLKKDLKAFLKDNPNCKKALKKLGIDIKKLFKTSNFTDTTRDTSDLQKTTEALGGNSTDLDADDLDETLESVLSNADGAATILGTNKVYLNSLYASHEASGRGLILVHELLHVFFKSGHVEVARSLGMSIDHNYSYRTHAALTVFKDGKWVKDGEDKTIRVDFNDIPAAQMINKWLDENCGGGKKHEK